MASTLVIGVKSRLLPFCSLLLLVLCHLYILVLWLPVVPMTSICRVAFNVHCLTFFGSVHPSSMHLWTYQPVGQNFGGSTLLYSIIHSPTVCNMSKIEYYRRSWLLLDVFYLIIYNELTVTNSNVRGWYRLFLIRSLHRLELPSNRVTELYIQNVQLIVGEASLKIARREQDNLGGTTRFFILSWCTRA